MSHYQCIASAIPDFALLTLTYDNGSWGKVVERVALRNDEKLSALEICSFFEGIIPLRHVDPIRYALAVTCISGAVAIPLLLDITEIACVSGDVGALACASNTPLSHVMDTAALDGLNEQFVY